MVEYFLMKDLIALRENISVHGNADYWQKKVKSIQDFGKK